MTFADPPPDVSEPLAQPGLVDGEIHVWHAVPDHAPDDPALESLLQADELKRCRSISFQGRRREYLLSRALVRSVLSRYSQTPPSGWRFRFGPNGRPELDPPSPLHFNLSHCNGLVACAVAVGHEIGLDIEPAGTGSAVLELAPRIFSPRERETVFALASPESRCDRALAIWTLKEAYLKARGVGLSLPLRSLTFTIGAGGIELSTPSDVDPSPDQWMFAIFEIGACRAAIAAGPGSLAPARLRLSPMWPARMAGPKQGLPSH